jgi:hypothetical protein
MTRGRTFARDKWPALGGAVFFSVVLFLVARHLHAQFPSFGGSCGSNAAAGCLEWSLVLVGPVWLGAYLIFLALLFWLVASPFLVLAAIWARSAGRVQAERGAPAPRMTVATFYKKLKEGSGPDA